ncbi:MAG: hypothetical protein CMQ40_04070 [Gammaproteobacteria bacterium]|nr:hypothetical protein [Gammaproteobacteria bacterium]|tara:strand:- start:530 stop:763 length:234 start_codon:yes stop_codon:yes gene_type:complete
MSYVRLFHALDSSLADLREVQSSIKKIKGLETELATLTRAIDRIDEKIDEINSKKYYEDKKAFIGLDEPILWSKLDE